MHVSDHGLDTPPAQVGVDRSVTSRQRGRAQPVSSDEGPVARARGARSKSARRKCRSSPLHQSLRCVKRHFTLQSKYSFHFSYFSENAIQADIEKSADVSKSGGWAEVKRRARSTEQRVERALTIANIASRECEDPQFNERVQQAVRGCRKRENVHGSVNHRRFMFHLFSLEMSSFQEKIKDAAEKDANQDTSSWKKAEEEVSICYKLKVISNL